MLGEKVGLIEGIQVSVVAMLIVFSILIIISVTLTFFKHLNIFVKQDTTETKTVNTPVKTETKTKLDLNDEDATVACLVACIEASEDLGYDVKVVNVKQI